MDEYGPSLVHVSAEGRVLTRYVPQGLGLAGADCPVVEALPGLLLHRRLNRGFEGLALLPGGDLVPAVQSPLTLPDQDAGESSRNVRLLRFSTKRHAVTAEYAYRFDAVDVMGPGEDDTSEQLSFLGPVPATELSASAIYRTPRPAHPFGLMPSSVARATPVR